LGQLLFPLSDSPLPELSEFGIFSLSGVMNFFGDSQTRQHQDHRPDVGANGGRRHKSKHTPPQTAAANIRRPLTPRNQSISLSLFSIIPNTTTTTPAVQHPSHQHQKTVARMSGRPSVFTSQVCRVQLSAASPPTLSASSLCIP